MAAKRLSISVSEEDFEYLEKDQLLSPSKIFQQSLRTIRENRLNLNDRIKVLLRKCDVMQTRIFELEDRNNVLEKERTIKK